jgi:hypothetical protein
MLIEVAKAYDAYFFTSANSSSAGDSL